MGRGSALGRRSPRLLRRRRRRAAWPAPARSARSPSAAPRSSGRRSSRTRAPPSSAKRTAPRRPTKRQMSYEPEGGEGETDDKETRPGAPRPARPSSKRMPRHPLADRTAADDRQLPHRRVRIEVTVPSGSGTRRSSRPRFSRSWPSCTRRRRPIARRRRPEPTGGVVMHGDSATDAISASVAESRRGKVTRRGRGRERHGRRGAQRSGTPTSLPPSGVSRAFIFTREGAGTKPPANSASPWRNHGERSIRAVGA